MKRTTAVVRLAALSSAAVLALTACSGGSGDDDGGSAASGLDYSTRLMNVSEPDGEPAQGGTLRVSEYSEARVLDPTQTYPNGTTGGNIMTAVYDTLMSYDHESGSFEPRLAESLESNDDSTVWTLTLREGVTFHDGTPLDADAVVASMTRYGESFGLNAQLLKQEVASMTAVDPRTVEITVAHEWPTFPYMLTNGPGMILAPAAYADPENFTPIGAGPFTFTSYSPSEKTVLSANEDYWDGRPLLDTLEFVVLGPDRAAYESLEAGDVDMALLSTAGVVDDAIESDKTGMVNALGLTSNFWINAREGFPGEDQRVRQAIALAIDPETYLSRSADGSGNPSKLLLSPDSPWSPGTDEMPTDAEKARELVEEAKADGFDGKVRFTARNDQASQAGAIAAQAMLEDAGFEVELDLLQNVADQVQKIYVDHDFDIAVASSSIADEAIYARMMSMLGSQSGLNVPGYANPEWDELTAQLQAVDNPDDAEEVLTQLEEIWAEDAPGVSIAAGAMINAWNPNVHGVGTTAESMVTFDKAWIED